MESLTTYPALLEVMLIGFLIATGLYLFGFIRLGARAESTLIYVLILITALLYAAKR